VTHLASGYATERLGYVDHIERACVDPFQAALPGDEGVVVKC